MSALYTAVKLGDAAWRDLRRRLTLGGVFDALDGGVPPGEHRGLLRLENGEEVGFRVTMGDKPGPDGLFSMEIHVDDANEAKLAKAEAEVTRLRAALSAIAALQTEEPFPDPDKNDFALWQERGRHEASSLAAKALGGGT